MGPVIDKLRRGLEWCICRLEVIKEQIDQIVKEADSSIRLTVHS